MFEVEQKFIEGKIRSYCLEQGLPEPGGIQWNPIPFAGEWGISTSFFQLAAQEARSRSETGKQFLPVGQRAQQIAAGVADALGYPPGFSRVEAIKGYLNLVFSPQLYSRQVLSTVLELGSAYGRGSTNDLVMVEFSQPNTHKAFHVGHLRSAILGDALARILEFAGYQVIRANYPGDIGLHVIKWLWNYMTFHSGEKPDQDITRWMGDLYAEANQRLEANPESEKEIRDFYARWDRGEPEVVDTWRRTRQWSLDGFNEIYHLLDIHFDRYYFNSEMEQPGKQVVSELIDAGIAQDERPEGPVIVRIDEKLGLDKEKYRVLVVLRSDNTALYSTEDLALAKQKFSDYPGLSRSFYVVDVRQSLHFQQVFKTLELAGFEKASLCQHIPYELVNLPGNVVMASREGTVVLLEELIREATRRARLIVEEKNAELSDEQKAEVAFAVAVGALRYTMLARDNTRTVTFDWETAMDFNGQAAPYIQYAQVRANSILRKAAESGSLPGLPIEIPNHGMTASEIQLVDWISRMPAEIQRAASELKPLHLTNLAYEMARAFTEFYNACPVLKADLEVRQFRLVLVVATQQVLRTLLNVLGIQAPEVM